MAESYIESNASALREWHERADTISELIDLATTIVADHALLDPDGRRVILPEVAWAIAESSEPELELETEANLPIVWLRVLDHDRKPIARLDDDPYYFDFNIVYPDPGADVVTVFQIDLIGEEVTDFKGQLASPTDLNEIMVVLQQYDQAIKEDQVTWPRTAPN